MRKKKQIRTCGIWTRAVAIICSDKSAFSTLDESFRDNMKFGDNSKVSVMGKGQVLIQTPGNTIQTISNVLFVPDLKTNLLSIAQLQEKGYEISIKGSSIRVLRTNRGGEYNSHEFADFCKEHGIKRQLTVAYTLQQNGMCERKNRTILSMVRSLLTRSKVPKKFWPEAINWSFPILNKSPTLAVQNMTPEEAWSDRRPDVCHFRIFECIVYPYVPDEKRRKLDDKGEKCIFLSVSDYSKAYKMYNPNTKKIAISRDVICDEASTWKGTKGAQQQILADFDEETGEGQQPVENVQQHVQDEQVTEQSQQAVPGSEPRSPRLRRRPVWMHDYEQSMMLEFDMSDLGKMHYFLGIEVVQSTVGIFILQRKYAQEVLDRFQMKGAVSWSLKKSAIVTLSTTEVEFVTATTCACQVIWLRKILEELHFKQEGAIAIYYDNSSAIKLSKNLVLHGRSKHIDVKFQFLRDLTRDEIIDFIHCKSEDQFADIMTKPLKLSTFQKLRQFIGVYSLNKSY
ncbi:hypothetical protein GH714_019277 [Hevea brasiliensis]|uniref:Integrase catalytic domain-containing protein n=1 Tax=Hevea brasiliensis TaxID=3981 RepID=A0A6A6L9E4_HEVBR|nr:hypothetical protein GH714_019277 [Hevea brasiliensis]